MKLTCPTPAWASPRVDTETVFDLTTLLYHAVVVDKQLKLQDSRCLAGLCAEAGNLFTYLHQSDRDDYWHIHEILTDRGYMERTQELVDTILANISSVGPNDAYQLRGDSCEKLLEYMGVGAPFCQVTIECPGDRKSPPVPYAEVMSERYATDDHGFESAMIAAYALIRSDDFKRQPPGSYVAVNLYLPVGEDNEASYLWPLAVWPFDNGYVSLRSVKCSNDRDEHEPMFVKNIDDVDVNRSLGYVSAVDLTAAEPYDEAGRPMHTIEMDEQPTQCGRCGSRTKFVELLSSGSSVYQLHVCDNLHCTDRRKPFYVCDTFGVTTHASKTGAGNDENGNSETLSRMECPSCHTAYGFELQGVASFLVYDDTYEFQSANDPAFVHEGPARCLKCDWTGTMQELRMAYRKAHEAT